MRGRLWGSLALLLGVIAAVACDDEPKRGAQGESCTSSNDCSQALACVAQVCIDRRAADADSDSDAGPGSSSGGSGAQCSARRECGEGLSCVGDVCQPISMGVEMSSRYSGVGESCRAKNDCSPDLSCVMNTCRQVNLPLSRTSKSCHLVECAKKEDCCAGFVPKANCADYRQNCMMDPVFCNTYRSLCECSQDCVDELCVAAPQGCASSGECTSMQTPYCLDNKCRQCDKDSACSGSTAKCVEGVCTAACTIDENCPLLHTCQDGACVDTGCQSDRECAFMLKNPQAVCHEKECTLPCTADTDCASDMMVGMFQVCDRGECVFVGCEADNECRALLMTASDPANRRAVCR